VSGLDRGRQRGLVQDVNESAQAGQEAVVGDAEVAEPVFPGGD
jgi:hypothetical protein